MELVRGHAAEQAIGGGEVIFPAELLCPPRTAKPRLTGEQIAALGDCPPVGGRVYAHGTMGGYVRAKCRCGGCRQWARDYGRERMRTKRAAARGAQRRRWERSRDADEPYLDEQIWDRIWAAAVAGITRTTFEGHTGVVRGVAFSPDGSLLATACTDGTARIWDTATRTTLKGHTGVVLLGRCYTIQDSGRPRHTLVTYGCHH